MKHIQFRWAAVVLALCLMVSCVPAPIVPAVDPSPTMASESEESPVLEPTSPAGVPTLPIEMTVTPAPHPQPSPSPSSDTIPTVTAIPTLVPTATVARDPLPENDELYPVVVLDTGAETLDISADSSMLVAGTAQGGVFVWDTATWEVRWSVAHEDHLRKVAFSPDGTSVGTVSFDNSAKLFDASSGEQILRLDFQRWVYGMDFSGDSLLWATGSLDGFGRVAHAKTGEILGEFKNELPVTDLSLSPAGPWLAVMTSGSWGPVELAVWDIQTYERRTLDQFDGLPCHSNVEFSPDTKWVAAAMSSGSPISIWQTEIWPQVASLAIPGGCVRQVTFSEDGRRLAAIVSGLEERDYVLVWEVGSWSVVSQMHLADVVWRIVLSPNGRWILAGLGQGIEHPPANEGQLWDADAGQLMARMPHSRQVLAVAFSDSGTLMATGSYEAVKTWSVPAWE